MRVFRTRRTIALWVAVALLGGFASLAAADDSVPLRNWKVPAYAGTGSGDDLGKLVDISPGVAFVAMTPCRMVDTRNAVGPYGGPKFSAGEGRNYDLDAHPTCTGIPVGVDAYSLNFTVTATDGAGFLAAYPTGTAFPNVSTVNYTAANQTVANAAIVPAGTGGSIHVDAAVSGTHVIIDINGYFTNQYNNNVGFEAIGNHSAQMGLFSNLSTAPTTYGLTGMTASIGTLSAGVKGVAGDGPPTIVSNEPHAGVIGLSKNATGVYGLSEFIGVQGHIHSPAGASLSTGFVGYTPTAGTNYGLYSDGDAHVQGTFTATTKSFVEPHPLDASKEIRYISVEAPSAEIYFRGTAQIAQGITRIDVPEHFRLVARPGSYATMVTPVGSMATVAVVSEDESGIVIQASRNVKVHYVVYAERASYAGHEPVIENVHFRPDAEGSFGAALPESYRQILVRNKSINPDGTVNADTAKRLGWKVPESKAHK